MPEAIKAFLDHIECSEYYEAHEVLEDLWRVERKEKTVQNLLLKALINSAVALYHHSRGNISGAQRCAQTYTKYRPLLADATMNDKICMSMAFERMDKILLVYFAKL